MLYTAKKTVSLIIHGGNDYIIGLKQNQPTLYKMAQTQAQHDTPLSSATTVENVHSRLVRRECKVFAAPEQMQKNGLDSKLLLWVERQGERDGQPFYERHSISVVNVSMLNSYLLIFKGIGASKIGCIGLEILPLLRGGDVKRSFTGVG
jgi:hypothetical protein